MKENHRRLFIRVLISVWLFFQIAIPFFKKFEFPICHYRFARFSWAMMSRPVITFQVSLFKRSANGKKEAVPNVAKYDRHFSPTGVAKMRVGGDYYTAEEIENWYSQLVQYISNQNGKNSTYGISIEWDRNSRPDLPANWEFEVPARK